MNPFLMMAVLVGNAIDVPKGSPAVLDGKVDEQEWKDASTVNEGPSGAIRLKHDGEFVYIGVTSPGNGIGSIHVADGDKVHILHASAALGTVAYERKGDVFAPANKFAWACRKIDPSPEALAERAAFLKEQGWLASVERMGNRGNREYKISRQLLKQGGAPIAIAYFDTEGQKMLVSAPTSTPDDVFNAKLIGGWLPETIRFQPESWVRLRLLG